MQIKLFFPMFNANQLFSPILGEYKNAKDRLKALSLRIQPQLKKYPRFPSTQLPANVHIVFYVNRDNFDVPALLLLGHALLGILRLSVVLQDVNNRCISTFSVSHKYTETPEREGCLITITH